MNCQARKWTSYQCIIILERVKKYKIQFSSVDWSFLHKQRKRVLYADKLNWFSLKQFYVFQNCNLGRKYIQILRVWNDIYLPISWFIALIVESILTEFKRVGAQRLGWSF